MQANTKQEIDTNPIAEATAVANVVTEHIKPALVEISRGEQKSQALVLPKGLAAHSIKPFLDEVRERPERRAGDAELGDLESFIAHVKRFADEGSALWANPRPLGDPGSDRSDPTISCIFDYHSPGAASLPRFGEHRGIYKCPLSEEWRAWLGKNGRPMSQAEFAEWVEARITDIADPSKAGPTSKALAEAIGCTFAGPTKLLELSRGLSVNVGAKVQNAVNIGTGEATVQFATEHADQAGKPLKVPGAFLVGLPVFRNGAPYELAARLRYRVNHGTITWFYELHRADRIFDHAFRDACDTAKKETGLPLFIGEPE